MRNRAATTDGFFVALGVVALTAAGASVSPRSSGAYGPSLPKPGGTVNLTANSNNDGPTSTLILTGDIGDYGRAVRLTTHGSKTPDDELQLSMTRGSFRLDITSLEDRLLRAFGRGFPTNEKTCSGVIEVSGTAPIVSGSGVRAYSGLHGSFHLTISINEVESWPTCPKNDTSPCLAQSVSSVGSGLVSQS